MPAFVDKEKTKQAIDQAEEFELVLNEKTAKALGIKIPDVLRFQAEVVQ